MERLECILNGRVQGVMFRDFARRHATKLGITGTVANTAQGSVAVVAEGERNKLNTFLELLKQGPMFADVRSVQTTWTAGVEEFTDFKIIYRSLWDRL